MRTIQCNHNDIIDVDDYGHCWRRILGHMRVGDAVLMKMYETELEVSPERWTLWWGS